MKFHLNNNSRRQNLVTNNSIKSKQGITNNINSNNNSINISKISEINNNKSIMTSESFLKNNLLNFNNNNTKQKNNNKEIIDELINTIKWEAKKNNIFQTVKIHFQKLSSKEKIDFLKIFEIIG